MVLYQTVEDRNNPDYIEDNAPFKCDKKSAWLGIGYYFWDTFLDNAHWWGETVYGKNEYVISEYFYNYSHEQCFDLHGNMEHIQYFHEIVKFLEEEKLLNDKTTVPWIIEYIKRSTDFLNKYEAIRVYGHYSKSSTITLKIYFSTKDRKNQFLELNPAVQLCLFNKTSLNFSRGKIIFPTKYISDYVL